MTLFEPIVVGLDQLRSNKMRSFLTLLGLLIGVAAVTGIVSLAEGLRTRVTAELDRMGGASLIFVSNPRTMYRDDQGRWVRRTHDTHLVLQDIDRILEEVPGVRTAIPREGTGGRYVRGRVDASGPLIGTTLGFQDAMDWRVERGRFLNRTDLELRRTVVVLGNDLAVDLFGRENPIGEEVAINGTRFDVIGVMEEKRIFDESFGNQAVIPITTLQRRLTGSQRLGSIQVQAGLDRDPEAVVADIRRVLQRYHRQGEDFRVESAGRQLEQMNSVILIMKLVGGGIAGISLLVGGIGIMNIMLVSVTERTREVGIRKAVGARRRDILVQFLLEAMVLAMVGGMLGIAGGWLLGSGLAAVISHLAGETFPAVISLQVGAGAVLFSGLIGIFFGVYPAVRASRLDPVDALRYE
jgi:putative ABC transport system permease protein